MKKTSAPVEFNFPCLQEEIGEVLYIIFSGRNNIFEIGTERETYTAEKTGENEILFVKDDGDTFDIDGWNRNYRGKKIFINPNATIPFRADLEYLKVSLKYGYHAYDITKAKHYNKTYTGIDEKQALKLLGLRKSKTPPATPPETILATTESRRGFHNEITGCWVQEEDWPETNLNEGYYWSERHNEYYGAATYDNIPEDELKNFFAALKPEERSIIAARLKDNTFDAKIETSYSEPKLWLQSGNHQRSISFDPQRGHNSGDDQFMSIMTEAMYYLASLQKTKTREKNQKVLSFLQDVEAGLAFYKMNDIIGSGNVVSHIEYKKNRFYAQCVAKRLKLRKNAAYPRQKLKTIWAESHIESTLEITHETTIADLGITPYLSRVMLAKILNKKRQENLEENHKRRERLAAETKRLNELQACIASRRPNDKLKIAPDTHHNNEICILQTLRDGKIVEELSAWTHSIDGFFTQAKLNPKRLYTRKYLQKLIARNPEAPWVKSYYIAQWLIEAGTTPQQKA